MVKRWTIIDTIEAHEQSLLDAIERLTAERDDYKKKYTELLTGSIQHADQMFGLVLQGAMNGAFTKPTNSGGTDEE